ncbi:MAG TPA: gamma-glutamylcyclotransferase [Hypericibacter adhaerens]|uniref:glutathione-specific gamma-glutamylcyclotransferase n=1 Tax=Hypericibacter adhaerens TaxID=2602016 RepID=A0A5J6N264_9PROT|nr:gamma-glutamylcyclotransferase [Hypericibacter adhaerens]QEX22680.1 gamma-glutamylcyclotransferase [Hypericibacter adhaerens]HWA42861.1 gamma-glutamylcyclotransferase [Hypericibacter adhaerens]
MSGRAAMTLTPELVARVHRELPDPGPAVMKKEPMTDDDYRVLTGALMAARQAHEDVWLFAYGSLIWKPACEVDGQRVAHLHGWHRKFCLRMVRFRGTPDCPGLMMGLDRGGSCRGVVQRLPHGAGSVERLLRREISVKPPANVPRWVPVESEGKRLSALAFTVDHKSINYAGDHTLEETAAILARACGHWGSCAEYLMQTVAHLEDLGIHDRYLWKLQARVAALIAGEIEPVLPVVTDAV